MKRKVVQIEHALPSGERGAALYALCDDGTVWVIEGAESPYNQWMRVEEIPQPEAQESAVLDAALAANERTLDSLRLDFLDQFDGEVYPPNGVDPVRWIGVYDGTRGGRVYADSLRELTDKLSRGEVDEHPHAVVMPEWTNGIAIARANET